jgi:DNA primase
VRISEASKSEIINRTDIVSVISEYVRLEKSGGLWKACCPFHNEKTPSFTVNPDKKFFYCFGCQKGGDAVTFIMEMDKLKFPEALELLAKKAGVPIVYDESGQPADRAARHKDELAALCGRVAAMFHYFLTRKPEGRHALEYIKGRGISDETISKFMLGYAPAPGRWLFGFLLKKGYSPEFLAESGLFSKKTPDFAFFRNRLIFPINDRYGKTIAFGGRVLPPDDGPKYLNSSDSEVYHKGETLFAIDLAMPEIRAKKEAIVCEGYMDVIALHQAGITNAVAPLGTAFTDIQARLLARWAERVLLLFDADNAGQNAAVKAILTCRKENLECAVITGGNTKNLNGNPAPKDPADILLSAGAKGLTKFVKTSIMDIEFLSARSKTLFRLSNPQEKARAVAYLFPFLGTIDSEVVREDYLKNIADEFGVAPESVRKDFLAFHENRSGSFGGVSRDNKEGGQEKTPPRMNDELYLLTAVLAHCDAKPELFSRLRSTLPIEEFANPDAKELYFSFEEAFRQGTFTTEAVLALVRNVALKNYLISKCVDGEFSRQPEKIVSDGITKMRIKHLRKKGEEITVEIRMARKSGADIDDLLAEKMFIDQRLQELGRR